MNTKSKKHRNRKPGEQAFASAGKSGDSGDKASVRRTQRPPRYGLIALFLVISVGGAIVVSLMSRPPRGTTMGYQVVQSYPHDKNAFTQGLLFEDGKLYESTGLDREDPGSKSQLKIVDLETGEAEKTITLPPKMFGEGLALLDGKLYQLTWQDKKVRVYDKQLNLIEELDYPGEGWGLTTDGRQLILSDGGANLKFLDPATLKVTRSIDVRYERRLEAHLNELEYVDGYVYANVWHEDYILKISPATGEAVAKIDLSGLHKHEYENVLNGIAYDRKGDRWFVTGKLWDKLYEVKFVERAGK